MNIEDLKITSPTLIDKKLGKLIKPGMTVLITKNLGNHRFNIGDICEITQLKNPNRYNKEVNYVLVNIKDRSQQGEVILRDIRILGIQRATLKEIVKKIERELCVYKELLDLMDTNGLNKDSDYIDVRKELIKKAILNIDDNKVSPEDKITKIVEVVDTLSSL